MEMDYPFVERIDAVFLPVKDLEKALAWYTDIFKFPVRWRNDRFAGLKIGNNVGFHLVQATDDYVPYQGAIPFNLAVKDVEQVRTYLISKGVRVNSIKRSEPVRFDFFDLDGNVIGIIQIG